MRLKPAMRSDHLKSPLSSSAGEDDSPSSSPSNLFSQLHSKTSVSQSRVIKEKVTPSRSTNTRKLAVFPRRSINLICSSSNSGKTTLLKKMLMCRDAFFEQDYVTSVCYFNCNMVKNMTHFENPFEEEDSDLLPPVTAYSLEEVSDIREVLRPGQIVILDDVVNITESVNFFITFASNHFDLVVFVVTQACLSTGLFQLVYKAHTLTAVYSNSSSTRLGRYLMSTFFLSREKRQVIRDILERAEMNGWALTLKLNNVASATDLYKSIIAFGNIGQLCDEHQPYAVVFFEPGKDKKIELDSMELGPDVEATDFVLVRATHVNKVVPSGSGPSQDNFECAAKDKWLLMNEHLVEEVEAAFDFKKRLHAIVLLKEILRVPDFCISSDYRMLLLRAKKSVRVSVIDFLQVATRRSHPLENLSKFEPYIPFVKILLKKKIPTTYIKNIKLLELAKSGRQTKKRSSTQSAEILNGNRQKLPRKAHSEYFNEN